MALVKQEVLEEPGGDGAGSRGLQRGHGDHQGGFTYSTGGVINIKAFLEVCSMVQTVPSQDLVPPEVVPWVSVGQNVLVVTKDICKVISLVLTTFRRFLVAGCCRLVPV